MPDNVRIISCDQLEANMLVYSQKVGGRSSFNTTTCASSAKTVPEKIRKEDRTREENKNKKEEKGKNKFDDLNA